MADHRTLANAGVTGYSRYVPVWRLTHASARRAWGTAGARGTRAVAGHDEDPTSMAVEAARRCVRHSAPPEVLYFATATPVYLEKSSATTVHAALGLPSSTAALDCSGATRSGMAALRAAWSEAVAGRRALAVAADVRSGAPGSRDEWAGGDVAAAVEFGGEEILARVLATGSSSLEVLDRWRAPQARHGRSWDERASEQLYVDAAMEAIDIALGAAGLSLGDIAWIGVAGLHQRARSAVTRRLCEAGARAIDDREHELGTPGCAQPAHLVGRGLDGAEAGERLLIVSLADGADTMILEATPDLDRWRRRDRPESPPALEVSYERFLVWRGELQLDAARRPDPDAPAPSPAARNREWKFALTGSRCEDCGTVHLPPGRVCVRCSAVDRMTSHSVRDREGVVVTFQLDYLNASQNPPSMPVVVDFEGGGRLLCELTDADPAAVRIGDRVRMSFRRMSVSPEGVQNYFWKARPVGAAKESWEEGTHA
ncbi:hydroxymethylglutaryl-CoA synthase family protein [Aeromicrobium phragmitis]|uniref:Hydroxymethylglutaryl-CoA synthase family protein n=1 Tax=Aeromicrobium phragmitis TaxID=2478914 RepID=A0A3L8PQF7_9ACTN|nr:OB-fold domain-containing protein [Aeromicrobium phragmitis]RLV57601.1 hydroxymethylglutaryl-CoA synthase family protein [Aeromicrobium phragmitis]